MQFNNLFESQLHFILLLVSHFHTGSNVDQNLNIVEISTYLILSNYRSLIVCPADPGFFVWSAPSASQSSPAASSDPRPGVSSYLSTQTKTKIIKNHFYRIESLQVQHLKSLEWLYISFFVNLAFKFDLDLVVRCYPNI